MRQRHQRNSRQPDMFCPPDQAMPLPAEARQRLLPLIGALLREVTSQAREAGHEDLA